MKTLIISILLVCGSLMAQEGPAVKHIEAPQPKKERVDPKDWEAFRNAQGRVEQLKRELAMAEQIVRLQARVIQESCRLGPKDQLTPEGEIIRGK